MPRKQGPKSLDDWITDRVRELSMSLGELANKAHVERTTLSNIRNGKTRGHPKSVRNIEAALGWALGSIEAIRDGGEPTVVDPMAALAGQPPSFRAPGYVPVTATDADDPAVQLRQIRQRMGATAFWREIEQMRDEDATLRGSASAS